MLYLGAVNGDFFGLGLPSTLPGPPPPDPNCPTGFTCQDIGKPGIAGSEVVNSDGSVTVTASGNGRTQGDQMRIITEPASGDFQISVQDISETAGNLTGYQQPQLGIVIRQSAALGAPFYTALQDPTYPAEHENVANVIMYYRTSWGGPVVELTQNYPLALPRYLMVQRRGDTFQTLFSSNGTNYTLISASGTRSSCRPPCWQAWAWPRELHQQPPRLCTRSSRSVRQPDLHRAERNPCMPHGLDLHRCRSRVADRR